MLLDGTGIISPKLKTVYSNVSIYSPICHTCAHASNDEPYNKYK